VWGNQFHELELTTMVQDDLKTRPILRRCRTLQACATPMVRWIVAGLFGCTFSLPLTARAQRPAVVKTSAESPSSFEVTSIKPSSPNDDHHRWDRLPGRFFIENYTLQQMIRVAYGLRSDGQVVGGPKWISRQAFDIQAKVDDSEAAKMRGMTDEQRDHEWNAMLRSLLADQFGLRMQNEERTLPVYALVVAKSGAKLTKSPVGETAHGIPVQTTPHSGDTVMTATTVAMSELADHLSRTPESDNRLVTDRTGLEGTYDFQLKWSRDMESGTSGGTELPGFLTALREQLGLELRPDKGDAPVVVVEAAKEPEVD
jgi:uncharacterized protein (TIGR03435 family)